VETKWPVRLLYLFLCGPGVWARWLLEMEERLNLIILLCGLRSRRLAWRRGLVELSIRGPVDPPGSGASLSTADPRLRLPARRAALAGACGTWSDRLASAA
jgi:hypothetical protein